MEVDLSKALLPVVRVRTTWYKVEYEGLPLICFECGKFGHRLEQCPTKIALPTACPASAPASARNPATVSHPTTATMDDCAADGGFFGPWMIAQRNSRKPRNPRGGNPKNHGGEDPAGYGKDFERSPIKGKGSLSNRYDIIADMMEEDNDNFPEAAENVSHVEPQVVRSVARNLNNDLAGHRVIPSTNKNQRSTLKPKNAGPVGPKNAQTARGSSTHQNTHVPLRISEGNKTPRSPIISSTVTRNKDKALVVAPLKESKTQNTIPKNRSRDRASSSKNNMHVSAIKTGPDLQRENISGVTADELLRMMRYERLMLAEQGSDPLDELSVSRVHGNDK